MDKEKRVFFQVLFLIFVLSSFGCSNNEAKAIKNAQIAEQYCEKAIVFYRNGDVDKAVENWEKAIEVDPQFVRALSNLGAAYKDKGMYDKAIAACEKAIQIDPAYIMAYSNLGGAYVSNNMNDQAVDILKKCIAIAPNFMDAYCNLAIAYENKGMRNEAISLLEAAIKRSAHHAQARSILSTLYMKAEITGFEEKHKNSLFPQKYDWDADMFYSGGKKERLNKAIEQLEKIIEINPKDMEKRCELADLYVLNWMKDKAILEYKKVLEMDPNFVNARYSLGIIYEGLKKWSDAIFEYEKVAELNPQYERVNPHLTNLYLRRGLQLAVTGDFNQAGECIKKIIKLEPEKEIEGFNAVEWLKVIEDSMPGKIKDKAAVLFFEGCRSFNDDLVFSSAAIKIREALKLEPDNKFFNYYLGYLNTCYGGEYVEINPGRESFKEAVSALQKAIKIDPQYWRAHSKLGLAYFYLGLYDESIAAGVKALSIEPNKYEIHNLLGMDYYAGKKNYAEAVKYFNAAIAIDPGISTGYYNVGLAYLGLLDKENALKQYNKLKDMGKDIIADILMEKIKE